MPILTQHPYKGRVVHYVLKIDYDTDETPNVSPAMITKINKDGTVSLVVFTSGGHFSAGNVVHDGNKARGTFHYIS